MAEAFKNTLRRGSKGQYGNKPPPPPMETGQHVAGLISCKNGTKVNQQGETIDIVKFFFMNQFGHGASLKLAASIWPTSGLSGVLVALSDGAYEPDKADESGAFEFLNNCVNKWYQIKVKQSSWMTPDGEEITWSWVDKKLIRPCHPADAPKLLPRDHMKMLEAKETADISDQLRESVVAGTPSEIIDDDDIPF